MRLSGNIELLELARVDIFIDVDFRMAQMIVVDPAVVAVLDLGRGLDPVGAGAAADATTALIVLNTASRLTTFLRESTGLSSRIICERLERSLTSMLIIEWAKVR